ncbi:hypothetical protein PG989_006851 [Apiospora arundinis]
MKFTPIATVFSSYSLLVVVTAMAKKIGNRADGDTREVVELCPNPDFQAIGSTVPCLNYTNPATPKGYGQRDTCVSLEGSPLHVGSPQGVSSVRLYGSLNCTLYKTETCEPDTPANGHIVPGTGESRLYGGAGPGDPDAIDDRTVAFRCRKPMGPRVPKKPQSVPFLA